MKINVLDKGFVELREALGGDLSVVNAARVSFGKQKTELDDKDVKLIKFLAKHKHMCYDGETEVFTKRGWIKWPNVTADDYIGAITYDGKMFYEKPSALICEDYSGPMYFIEHRDANILVTPNHRMFISRRGNKGFKSFEVLPAKDIIGKQYRLKTSVEDIDGQGGTYYEGYIYGFFLGDGKRINKQQISFRLKKHRKINALKQCLDYLNISYNIKQTSDKIHCFVVNIDNPKFIGNSHTVSFLQMAHLRYVLYQHVFLYNHSHATA